MLGRNFLPNATIVRLGNAVAAGQDGDVQESGNVDLQANGGARRVVLALQLGSAVAGGVVDLSVRTRAGTSGNWTTVGSVSNMATEANKFVAIEADTNSVRLQRYVQLGYQRKTQDIQIVAAFALLCELRQPGDLTRGDVVAAAVVSEKSANRTN